MDAAPRAERSERLAAAGHGPGRGGLLLSVAFLLVAGAAIAAYRPALHAPFVFDSVNNIAENASIRMTRVDLPSLVRAAFPSERLNLRPLAFITFALNHRVGGLDPFGYRVVNLLILLATVPAAYWLALLIVRARPPAPAARQIALSAAAVWALHPVLTNGVTYVVQRMTSLSTLFGVLALAAFCSARLERRRGRYATAAALWLLALAAKETALIFPLLALLFLWHVAPEGGRRRRNLARVLVAAAVASQVALIALSAQIVRLGWVPETGFSLAQRVLTEGRVVATYVGLFLLPLPSRLSLDYSFALSTSLFSPPSTIAAFALHALLIGGALALRRRRPVACFSALAFYLLQLAEGTVLPVDLIFEHRLYFPSLFLALAAVDLLAWGLAAVAPRRWEQALAAAVAVVALCLAFLARERNLVWADPVALWRDTVAKAPSNPRAQLNFGSALERQGRHEEALEVYRRLLKLAPDYRLAHYNEGNALQSLGRHREAIDAYRRATLLDPGCSPCYNNLGSALFQIGSLAEAQRSYTLALEHDPGNDEARFNLGLVSVRLGRREDALAAYRELARRQPELARRLLAEMR